MNAEHLLSIALHDVGQEKEDPEMAMELRKMSIDYERRRMQLQVHYGNMLITFVCSTFHCCSWSHLVKFNVCKSTHCGYFVIVYMIND